ncbi:MAG: alpha/beta hydrolase [Xanthomonadaceae bacterium]|nr:alpha/beta hydrolase [Xanthomonadaceae bacterium]
MNRPFWQPLALTLLLLTGLPAAPATAAGALGRTDLGVLDGAAYRIDVPARWNGGLVVFFHGYQLTPERLVPGPLPPDQRVVLARGYALAQSGYREGGWTLDQSLRDTAMVERRFEARFGKPRETLVMGMSMGGLLTVKALETEPARYAGGLALCGAIMPSDRLQQRAFAQLAALEYYAPGLLGDPARVPADYRPDAAATARVQAALLHDPRALHTLSVLVGSDDPGVIAGVLAFERYLVGDIERRAGGNPFATGSYLYLGTGDDIALNAGVRRYAADPAAARWLERHYTPTGRLARPLLELHTLHDPLIHADVGAAYALLAQRQGDADEFVQQYVPSAGHCTYTPADVARAFDELLDWVHHGRRPAPGPLPQ